jgi:hypothetical protein
MASKASVTRFAEIFHFKCVRKQQLLEAAANEMSKRYDWGCNPRSRKGFASFLANQTPEMRQHTSRMGAIAKNARNRKSVRGTKPAQMTAGCNSVSHIVKSRCL